MNKVKTEAFWFVFKSICYKIFTNFPKKNRWWGENRKEPHALPSQLNTETFTPLVLTISLKAWTKKHWLGPKQCLAERFKPDDTASRETNRSNQSPLFSVCAFGRTESSSSLFKTRKLTDC